MPYVTCKGLFATYSESPGLMSRIRLTPAKKSSSIVLWSYVFSLCYP